MEMKQVIIGNLVYTDKDNNIVKEVADILERDNFQVELFGIDMFAETLDENIEIIDYKSRATLALIRDGEVIKDKGDIEETLLEEALRLEAEERDEVEELFYDEYVG